MEPEAKKKNFIRLLETDVLRKQMMHKHTKPSQVFEPRREAATIFLLPFNVFGLHFYTSVVLVYSSSSQVIKLTQL